MIRPMQAILKSFKLSKERNSDKKKWGVGGKQAQSDLADYIRAQRKAVSINNLAKELHHSMQHS